MLAITSVETTPLIDFSLPGTPYSVQIARFYTRAALNYHGLSHFARDAQAIISELVTNAIEHAGAASFSASLLRLPCLGRDQVVVIVSDPSPDPPVKRDLSAAAEHGRGLLVVEALSSSWGWQWRQDEPGKDVYAILAAEA
jgi:anti-sigma regulatory factor (Ser/Thr protein kinase)